MWDNIKVERPLENINVFDYKDWKTKLLHSKEHSIIKFRRERFSFLKNNKICSWKWT